MCLEPSPSPREVWVLTGSPPVRCRHSAWDAGSGGGSPVATTSTSRSPLPPSVAVELRAPLQERPGETQSSPVRGVLRAFPSRSSVRARPRPLVARSSSPPCPRPRHVFNVCLPSPPSVLLFFLVWPSLSLFFSLLLPPFNKSVLSNTYYVLLREQEDRRTCPHALPWELSI